MRQVQSREGVPEIVQPYAFGQTGSFGSWGDDVLVQPLQVARPVLRPLNATSEQVRAQAARALEADARRVQRTVLQRLFDPTEGSNEWQHRVFGLYNGTDGIKPPSWLGRNFAADHNHYLVSGSATLDSEDLELGMAHLTEHGFGVTSVVNGNPSSIYILVNPAEADVISTFRAGVENANGKKAKHDFIPSSAVPPCLTDKTLVGTPPPVEVAPGGLPILGQYGLGLVVQDYVVPQGYVVIVASGGPNSPANAIGLRSHERPEYRGLRLIAGNYERFPIAESFYQRSIGAGTRRRGAAVVIQCKATGSYEAPTIAL
ncbi:hypothetical protein [Mycolicibacterium setense]|uniref:hypothetical protein n=1 Tax=Mycolicibacterium setense TaxID=431269 RepID=UPI0012FEB794|nr:hypothetical protein [Mycolicibacterium setense]